MNHVEETQRLMRRLERERSARQQAELLLEKKSLELYEANAALRELAKGLEEQVMQRTQDLQAALHQAERATEAKSNFLATMSHEIRTPLHGILGTVDLLETTSLSSEQKRYVSTMHSSGVLLLGLINDILDLSKIESGHLNLELREVDLMADLSPTLEAWSSIIRSKKLHFQVEIAPDVPRLLRCDSTRIAQILINLLSNAIKFTTSGSVSVSIEARSLEETSVEWVCSVQDTGIGMSEATRQRLFRPFSQGDSSTTRRYGGTGLGLSICKSLCEAMGGSIEVRSIEGQGTTFVFSLPLQRSNAVVMGKVSWAARAVLPSTMEVLVVDDNEVNRMLASAMLGKLGVRCTLASNGQDAITCVKQMSFDVVFMDMQMPVMDGMEATRIIRSTPLLRRPVIVAMTANAYETDRQTCRMAGMDDFLSKPYSLNDLSRVLQKFV